MKLWPFQLDIPVVWNRVPVFCKIAASKLALVALIVAGLPSSIFAVNHYINSGASGNNSGATWANAWTNLGSVVWTRGDTYYVGTGSFGPFTFNAPVNGSKIITVKKATVADHGSDTGWDNSMAAQAVFTVTTASINFATSFWVFDGNGANALPSNNTNDYGFLILNSSTNVESIGFKTNDITFRHVHVYASHNADDNSDAVAIGYWPFIRRVKLQNCWIENSGYDGLELNSSSYGLVERCWLTRLGIRMAWPGADHHGQAVQLFGSDDSVIFRWNVFEWCEGQSLLNYGNTGSTNSNLRFYGNVVFNRYNTTNTWGFNAGILDDSAEGGYASNVFFYNNTYVNLRRSYNVTNTAQSMEFQFRSNLARVTNCYHFNDLFFNCDNSISPRFAENGYHASGGLGTASGTNQQMGILSSIFADYPGDNFRLAAATLPGLILSDQPWWNTSPDNFFGQLDYATDLLGTTRGSDGNWDRGAFEFNAAQPQRPSPPRNLRTNTE